MPADGSSSVTVRREHETDFNRLVGLLEWGAEPDVIDDLQEIREALATTPVPEEYARRLQEDDPHDTVAYIARLERKYGLRFEGGLKTYAYAVDIALPDGTAHTAVELRDIIGMGVAGQQGSVFEFDEGAYRDRFGRYFALSCIVAVSFTPNHAPQPLLPVLSGPTPASTVSPPAHSVSEPAWHPPEQLKLKL